MVTTQTWFISSLNKKKKMSLDYSKEKVTLSFGLTYLHNYFSLSRGKTPKCFEESFHQSGHRFLKNTCGLTKLSLLLIWLSTKRTLLLLLISLRYCIYICSVLQKCYFACTGKLWFLSVPFFTSSKAFACKTVSCDSEIEMLSV